MPLAILASVRSNKWTELHVAKPQLHVVENKTYKSFIKYHLQIHKSC